MYKLQQLNVLGLIALIPGVVCLCLALQWGGFEYNVSVCPLRGKDSTNIT